MTAPRLPRELDHRIVKVNGVSLHVVAGGPPDGPLVLLLHGFPEFWYGWHHQIGPLVEAGYRVVVPDQRGYNLSDKPRRLSDYRIEPLCDDVDALVRACGGKDVTLVGHDWGGAVAWFVAARRPEWLSRLVILNMPHPAVMRRTLFRSRRQLRRSQYILFFQIPLLPEWLLARDDYRALTVTLQRATRPGAFSEDDLDRYRTAYDQPGALAGMLSWYRASVLDPLRWVRAGRIACPTLLVWGRKDRALGWEMAQPSIDRCDRGRLVFIEEAGHFVTHDAWAEVNELLLDFLGAPAQDRATAGG